MIVVARHQLVVAPVVLLAVVRREAVVQAVHHEVAHRVDPRRVAARVALLAVQ